MSVNKFKFVSPGVFVSEIDNSQLPALPRGVGPVVVGRSLKGPSLRPVQIDSFSDFVETFGEPIFGGGSSDGWRAGPNVNAPGYATYAAQAYLRNESPLVFVRLAGIQDAQASGDGVAGWEANGDNMSGSAVTNNYNGGAFGLFLIRSGSSTTNLGTGSLAAIFYARTGSVGLSGTLADGETLAEGTAGLFKSDGNAQFTAVIKDASGTQTDKVVFNFNENSKLFIRNVFNTNPPSMNDNANVVKDPSDNSKTYFLGESFERSVAEQAGSGDSAPPGYGVILGLDSGSYEQHIQRMPLADGKTGWFFAQDLGTSSAYVPTEMARLFRLVGIGGGDWAQNNLKISITSITPSNNAAVPYGYFTVQIRHIGDSDNNPRPVETYSDVDLNPNSPNFISRKIGDTYTTWDPAEKRYTSYGDYVNRSRYVRVELGEGFGQDAKHLPFGILGPARWKGFVAVSGSSTAKSIGAITSSATAYADVFAVGNDQIADSLASLGQFVYFGPGEADGAAITASFEFPRVPTRTDSSDGVITNQKSACFGATTNLLSSNRVDDSIKDMLRRKPGGTVTNHPTILPNSLEYAWAVSLDDIQEGTSGVLGTWVSGSRVDGNSFTALGGSEGYKAVLDEGFNKITAVINGGFEGVDILENEPFRNGKLKNGTPATNYAFASVDRAIDTCADAEVVECNMMTIPGVTNPSLTSKLLDICEARGDALGVIDLEGGYIPPTEDADETSRLGSVSSTISSLNDRNLNNSYGCAYYPWCQVTDTVTTGGSLWVPPSVVALGTLASSQAASELWFAPAGFNRGGLSEGSAGLPVTNVRTRLNSSERDDLYNANINPIAQFPAEGIVIFGQKTLQVTRSALDRINVRRLMIYVKREISRISATLLFDQNVSSTWNRFLGEVNPFLGSIKTRLGLTDFKVVLDETTTTPDLVDRNIMYAKIFLKPARAIEFIALDFVITRSGASFED